MTYNKRFQNSFSIECYELSNMNGETNTKCPSLVINIECHISIKKYRMSLVSDKHAKGEVLESHKNFQVKIEI